MSKLRVSIQMQKLVSLPENLVSSFHDITGKDRDWFVLSDPGPTRIGSGGGTAWLLAEHKKACGDKLSFEQYLAAGKKLIIHAGGQSRRLPAYAPSGKVLAPIPVFRWSQGQRLDQSLLDLQIPLLDKIMETTGPSQNVIVAAGDILIQLPEIPYELPDADVVCFGMWVDPQLASNHGVFFTSRTDPNQLDFMLQKPEHSTIEKLAGSHLYLMDIGIWVLSDRAVELLMKKCGWNGREFDNHQPLFYDLYGAFGTCLGDNPSDSDEGIRKLSTAIVPMDKGEFYHYGTSAELITSTERIQNKVLDQRNIWHYSVKPHPSLFVQNALADISWTHSNHHVWIENSHVPSTWSVSHHHVITGVPGNDWDLVLNPGNCLDIVPIGQTDFCIRSYAMEDSFRGRLGDKRSLWMGLPFSNWLKERGISFSEAKLYEDMDLQSAPLFPVTNNIKDLGNLVKWIMAGNGDTVQRSAWLALPRISADEISSRANLKRLFRQREQFRQQNMGKLALNFKRSVFYQSDLKFAASEFARAAIEVPDLLPPTEAALLKCRNHMFRAELLKMKGMDGCGRRKKSF